jgi:glycosyltransferase involved in cell wall biosynthesis
MKRTRGSPLRILKIIETGGPGGAETVFAQLASGLAASGHEVQCLVGRGTWLPDEMTKRGIPTELIDSSSAFRFIAHVNQIVRAQRIQIVHAHLFDGAMYAAIAARLSRTPILATLHGHVDIQREGLKQRAKHLLFRSFVTRTVAVSQALLRDLQPALSLADSRVTVVHNGIEAKVSSERSSQARGPDAPLRLLAVGNIRPAKDYPTLLQALRLLIDRDCNVVLEIAGQPDSNGLFERLSALRQSLQLEQVVTFRGFVPDTSSLLADTDVFVLSSDREGFSLATIEAMLAGVTVVATKSGGPEEIIRDGHSGLLVPPATPSAIADAISTLASEPSVRVQLAANALKDVGTRFGISRMIDEYETLYRDCLR